MALELKPNNPSDKDYVIIWYLNTLIESNGQRNMYPMHGAQGSPSSNDIIWAQEYLTGQGYIKNVYKVVYQITEPTGRNFFNSKVYDYVINKIINSSHFVKVSSVISDLKIKDEHGSFSQAILRRIKKNYSVFEIEENDGIMLTEDAKEKYYASKHNFGDEEKETTPSIVVTGNHNAVGNTQSSFDKSFNAEASNKTPAEKSKIPWKTLAEIIAGILLIILAILKFYKII
jgi:hypothetical protein